MNRMLNKALGPVIGVNLGMGIGRRDTPVVAAGASRTAPDGIRLFHQRHFNPGPGGADSGPAPGDASADNQDIGFDFLFLIIAYGVGPGVGLPYFSSKSCHLVISLDSFLEDVQFPYGYYYRDCSKGFSRGL